MNKIKCMVLLFGFILPTAFGFANSELTTEKDGVGTIVINKSGNDGFDRSATISASINGHYLNVFFSESLGEVSVEISTVSGTTISFTIVQTPTGYQCHIPNTGNYIVTFTLQNGDEYYGEFEVIN